MSGITLIGAYPKHSKALMKEMKDLNISYEDALSHLTKIIRKGFEINKPLDDEMCAIHLAAEKGNLSMLKALIAKEANINIQGKNNYTPIITSMKSCSHWDAENKVNENECQHLKCFLYLLEQEDIKLEGETRNRLTPIAFMTMHIGFEELEESHVEKLLENKVSLKELSELYELIKSKKDNEILVKIETLSEKLGTQQLCQLMFTKFTLFQISCIYGFTETAKWLFEQSNTFKELTPGSHLLPIRLICRYARPEILKLLMPHYEKFLPTTNNGRTMIHLVVKSLSDSNIKDSYKCLKKLLKWDVAKNQINDKDSFDRTALHYAAALKNEECVLELLENGAHIDVEDCWEKTPLEYIEYSTFSRFLDSRLSRVEDEDGETEDVSENDNASDSGGRKSKKKTKKYPNAIRFNFENLFRKEPNVQDNDEPIYTFPTSILSRIAEKEHLKSILSHPTISIIIFYKWFRIQWIYISYLIFYFTYCVIFTYNVLPDGMLFVCNYNTPCLKITPLASIHPKVAPTLETKTVEPISVILILMTFYLAIIELIKVSGFMSGTVKQFIKAFFKKYIWSLKNALRLLAIVYSGTVIFELIDNSIANSKTNISISILLNGLELFFLVGQLPHSTDYVIRFQSVCWNFARFLFFHAVLVLSFSYSFYVLFHDVNVNPNLFSTPLNAVFKTIVMLTGEYEAQDIPFDATNTIASRFIFVGFVFIATIVLYNLMLDAVFTGVRKKEQDPFLYKNLARLEVIIHFEENYLDNTGIVQERLQYIFFFKWLGDLNWLSHLIMKIHNYLERFDLYKKILEYFKWFDVFCQWVKTLLPESKPEAEQTQEESKKGAEDIILIINDTKLEYLFKFKPLATNNKKLKMIKKEKWLGAKYYRLLDQFFNFSHLDDEVVEKARKIVMENPHQKNGDTLSNQIKELNSKINYLENVILSIKNEIRSSFETRTEKNDENHHFLQNI